MRYSSFNEVLFSGFKKIILPLLYYINLSSTNAYTSQVCPRPETILKWAKFFRETRDDRASEFTGGRVARPLMDYITIEAVTFELRSIIRNCAVKASSPLIDGKPSYEGLHVYTRWRHDATRLVSPRSSDFNKNVKFYFQIRCHRRRSHRSCSLSSLSLSSFWVLASFHHPPARLFPAYDRIVIADTPRVIKHSRLLFFSEEGSRK